MGQPIRWHGKRLECFPVVKAQEKVVNTEGAPWCLDSGNALQNESFCGSVIHIDLLGAMVADHR